MTESLLRGVRVLDLSRVLAGPVCCQVLADLGADVVKVERPGTGDDTRQWGPPFVDGDGPSAYFLSANRGKRSVTLDLSNPHAHGVLVDLVRSADVLVENFLPRTLQRLRLRPEDLHATNPQLVSVSISGFGRTGPFATRPGYDLVLQAASGVMSITGEADGVPMKIGVAITDVLTGLYAAVSALAGLCAAGRGRGRGTSFDLALADCTLASLVNVAQGVLVTGERPKRYGNAHPHIVPYEAFATSDGYLVLAIGNDRQFERFCTLVERPDWPEDERFATNPARVRHRAELIPQIADILRGRATHIWQSVLTQSDIPHAPVAALDEVVQSPQTAARQMVRTALDSAGRRYRLLASPIHYDNRPSAPPKAPPALGQHTDEVLGEWLGYDAAKLDALRGAGLFD